MRGKLDSLSHNHVPTRITPAGAGKTFAKLRQTKTYQDHPRRCGENKSVRFLQRKPPGSPPQVRGKPLHQRSCIATAGITPAGAGKTQEKLCKLGTFKDHPRRCGENSVLEHASITVRGSPPQVRGKPVRRAGIRLGHGITPAGAGKTSR